MNELIYNQLYIFFVFIVTGLCLGLLFDSFRIQRMLFKTNNVITYIQDVLFWIISGILFVVVVSKYTDGVIRIYMLQGLLVGIIIYYCLFSKLLIKLVVRIVSIFASIFRLSIHPIKKLLKRLEKE